MDGSSLDKGNTIEVLLTNLKDENEYIRGKSLVALKDLGELAPLEPIITCLFDEKYWIREVAASILRFIGKARSPELFEKLCQIVIRELSISKINNPRTGTSPVDYIIRRQLTRISITDHDWLWIPTTDS